MKGARPALRLLPLVVGSMTVLFGCSKPAVLRMPKPLPSIVKEYRSVTLFPVPGMQNTRVHFTEGDLYSLFATGTINVWPKGPAKYRSVKPDDGWPLMVRIGEKNWFFHPFNAFSGNSITATSPYSGDLYLGIKDGKVDRFGKSLTPRVYADNLGSFTIDIIVWRSDDYVQIAAFLKKLKEKDPENQAILRAFSYASSKEEIYLAFLKASKEIEETKKQIRQLQEEDVLTGGTEQEKLLSKALTPTTDVSKDKEITELQMRLVELTERLSQLEQMEKQLEEEREKTTLLSQELSQKEMREQELLSQLEGAENTPPVIVVASPKNGTEVEVGTITFSGVVEDDKGLRGLELMLNGVPVEEAISRSIRVSEKQHPRRLEFSERIGLQKGRNEVRIRAVDTDGFAAEEILTVHYRELGKNVWAVVIGIDRYQNSRHLKFAVKDARAFYDHLIQRNRIPAENVILLVDEEAGLTRLRSVLGTYLKKMANREDMVIIYFAGHGACEKDMTSPDKDGLEKYILPCDADPEDLYASALPMTEVSRIFNRIRSERLIFIADACYSGASGGRTINLTGLRATISEGFLDRMASGRGRIILTASGANEVSGEDEDLGHGVFTYFLLEALRGRADMDRDGVITVDEVYRYVSREVPKATGQEQHPVKKGIVEGELILGVVD